MAALSPNNAAVIKLLVQHGAEIDRPDHMSVLAHADFTNLQCLTDAGADVNWPKGRSWTALAVQVQGGTDDRAIRFLLDHGANPNPPGDSLVLVAAKHRRGDVAKMLLQAGAALGDDKGGTALYWAIRLGEEDLLHALLGHGADATWCDAQEISLVLNAVRARYWSIIEDLLRAGADPNKADKYGSTPLWEVRNREPQIAEVLRRYGARLVSPEQVLAERMHRDSDGK
ncbi:MAG: uncharacterized protein JWN51_286 [Phycisphaerales bacterium]|nr:uncharacterized protein [Phycisphaerales bacterium]